VVAAANPGRLFLARKLAARFKLPLLNPLLVAMVVIIPFLLLTGISYERYLPAAKFLTICCSRR
jgi:putative effector of murein hydrolase